MKNQKRYLILSIIFWAILGFSLAPACASELGANTYNTGTQYFKQICKGNPCTGFDKAVTSQNKILGHYCPKNWKYSQGDPNELWISFNDDPDNQRPPYKITKVVVEFRKTVNGQVQKSTKTFQKGTEGWMTGGVLYKPKNDYTPYSAVVYYQKR